MNSFVHNLVLRAAGLPLPGALTASPPPPTAEAAAPPERTELIEPIEPTEPDEANLTAPAVREPSPLPALADKPPRDRITRLPEAAAPEPRTSDQGAAPPRTPVAEAMPSAPSVKPSTPVPEDRETIAPRRDITEVVLLRESAPPPASLPAPTIRAAAAPLLSEPHQTGGDRAAHAPGAEAPTPRTRRVAAASEQTLVEIVPAATPEEATQAPVQPAPLLVEQAEVRSGIQPRDVTLPRLEPPASVAVPRSLPVEVHIGTIEVMAHGPPQRVPRPAGPRPPAGEGFAEYFRLRNYSTGVED